MGVVSLLRSISCGILSSHAKWSLVLLAGLAIVHTRGGDLFSIGRFHNKRESPGATALDRETTRELIVKLKHFRRCTGVYLDIGSNIGVQVRKLYAPELYPGALVEPFFQTVFGKDRSSVCVIGLEANEVHTARLKKLESILNSQGHTVIFLTETAVMNQNGFVQFYRDLKADAKYHEWGASTIAWQGDAQARVVRSISLSTLLAAVLSSVSPSTRLIMKLDIEGAEYAAISDSLTRGYLCSVEIAFVEFHPHFIKVPENFHSSIEYVLSHSNCNSTLSAVDDETYFDDPVPLR